MLSVPDIAPIVFWLAALAFSLAVAARLSFRPLVALPLLASRFTRRADPRATPFDPFASPEPR